MTIAAILNPAAGSGRGAAKASAALRDLPSVRVHESRSSEHTRDLARQLSGEGVDVIVACGGDGTLFDVVGGMMLSEQRRSALAVLPVGTGNSFIRDLGISDLTQAVRAIRDGNRRKTDVLEVQHADGRLYSINLVSFGFSAIAGDLTNRRFKPFGVAGYVSAVMASLVRLEHHVVPFSLDDGAYESRPMTLLSFCNSRYTGGAMQMAPGAKIDDGLFDVIRIGPMNRRRFLSCFPKIFRGSHVEMPEVQVTRASTARFADVGPLPVMIDGEIRRIRASSIKVLPAALEVIVPGGAP